MKLSEKLLGSKEPEIAEHEKYPVSINLITTDADLPKTVRLFPSIPKGVEIVIVNSVQGDTDSEVVEEQVAGGKLTRLITRTFTGSFHFADARNCAKRHSTRPWIFWVDSDDEIVGTKADTLFEQAKTLPDGIGGVFCGCTGFQKGIVNGLNQYVMPNSYYAIAHVRLFRNHPKIWWIGKTHEQIADSIQENHFDISWSDLMIQHHGYNCDAQDMYARLDRNITGMCEDLAKGDNTPIRTKGLQDLILRDISSLQAIIK